MLAGRALLYRRLPVCIRHELPQAAFLEALYIHGQPAGEACDPAAPRAALRRRISSLLT